MNRTVKTRYGVVTREVISKNKIVWVTHVNGARRNWPKLRDAKDFLIDVLAAGRDETTGLWKTPR